MRWITDVAIPRIAARVIPRVRWTGSRDIASAYLTFDDGPTPETTPAILDALDRHGVKGTFFMLGRSVAAFPELVRAVADRGHDIGVHGHDHLDGWRTSMHVLAPDFQRAYDHISDAIGRPPIAYRPPYGHLRPGLVTLARRAALPVVMWDFLCGDFRPQANPTELAERSLRAIRPGSILALHDNAQARTVAVPLVEQLLARAEDAGLSLDPLSSIEL